MISQSTNNFISNTSKFFDEMQHEYGHIGLILIICFLSQKDQISGYFQGILALFQGHLGTLY